MRDDPGASKGMTFHDAVPHFATGQDTPRACLERCLAQIASCEPVVKAFAVVNEVLARAAADASSARWKAGQPLSAIDGMPIAVDVAIDLSGTAVRSLHDAGALILGQTVTAGAAAAVAARLCAAAFDAEVGGGVIRSASTFGNFAFEPTPGGLPHGVHAGGIEDLWRVASVAIQHAGGGPFDPDVMPDATRPGGLIVIESAAWRTAGESTRTAFEALLDQIACTGVTLRRRRDHPSIEALEQIIAMKPDDHLALRQWRDVARREHACLASLADAIVMLSAPGALLRAPAVNLPLMSVQGLPVGAQLVGQADEDARTVSVARWVALEAGTVVV